MVRFVTWYAATIRNLMAKVSHNSRAAPFNTVIAKKAFDY